METIEEYLPPKAIADEIFRLYRKRVKYRRLLEIRAISIRTRDGLFVDGEARPTEVYQWIVSHPELRYRRY